MISRYALCLRGDSDSGADCNGILIFAINFNFRSRGDGVIDRDFTVGGLCLLGLVFYPPSFRQSFGREFVHKSTNCMK